MAVAGTPTAALCCEGVPTFDGLANFGVSAVATAPLPATTGTSLIVSLGTGVLYPTPPFNAVVWPQGVRPLASNSEIVRVTAKTTDTFTITRAQEGTSARTILVGDQIAAAITSKTLTDLQAAINAVVTPVVATTVAGLGAGVDGKIGLLRVGASPYNFFQVHYDATYGKWVSDFVGHVGIQWSESAEYAIAGYAYFVGDDSTIELGGLVTAGLKPQVWMRAGLDSSSADGTLRVGAIFASSTDHASVDYLSAPGSTSDQWREGWLTNFGTLDDETMYDWWFWVEKVGGTTGVSLLGYSQIGRRWVS
jgi:hypothetical protein